ncbi:hypothetical protein EJB05_07977, partial [Eragrostis curvula]
MGARLLQLLAVFALCFASVRSGDWLSGTATFYGGADGSGTMGGACGYGNLYNDGYGVNNAALRTALFNDGASCGQCYVVICDRSKALGTYAVVSATNFCPPNRSLPDGGWCAPSRPHFDMSQPAWENIGVYSAGIIPVMYQRVKCWRSGGVRFTINGCNYFELVLVTNMAGSGSVQEHGGEGHQHGVDADVQELGRQLAVERNARRTGAQLQRHLQSSTGGQSIVFQDVVPAWWQFGQTFFNWQQFDY